MHRLTDVSAAERTAICSVCGPTRIHKKGAGFTCANKARDKHARWAAANPDFAAENRKKKSAHVLTDKNPDAPVCLVCGPTQLVAYGRGWACANTPAVTRRAIQQVEPTRKCNICSAWESMTRVLNEDGRCPVCAADMSEPVRAGWGDAPDRDENVTSYVYPYGGYTVFDPEVEWTDPGPLNAVPGWTVIGSERIVNS